MCSGAPMLLYVRTPSSFFVQSNARSNKDPFGKRQAETGERQRGTRISLEKKPTLSLLVLGPGNILAGRMTAQKLTKSSSTDAFKAFKHALQPKKVHPGKVELNRREREAMSQQQQQQQQQPMAASSETVWGDAAHGAGLRDSVTCEGTAAISAAPSATASAAAASRPATVEPDSHHPEERRHTPAVTVTTAAVAAAAAAPSTRGGAVAAPPALLPCDERGSAVPVSPPSSPMHVATQPQTAMGPAAAAAAAAGVGV
ncbi:unnamed protein product, partial [Laminaria digitata]